MAGKQLYNQRKILKIHSSRLEKANWDLEITLKEAYGNEEVVSLGDSQLLGFIRVANGGVISLEEEDRIREIKKEIKRSLKEKVSKGNTSKLRNKIKELYEELDVAVFEPNYVSIQFENKKDFNRACKGFKINGENFVRCLGTTGGVKNNTVIFIAEKVSKEVNRRLNAGVGKKFKIVPAKYEAYKALSASGSTPVTTPKMLIIKDGATTVQDKAIRISDNGKGGFQVEHNVDYLVEGKEFCDGCGMMLPSYAKKVAEDMQLDYTPAGVNTRYLFNKGMLCQFDYIEFGEKIAHSYIVKDAWGAERDIRDYEVILTTNMVKCWSAYDSLEHYCKCAEEYGYQFRIAKVTPKALEESRNSNYQYLQSFEEFTDDDIVEFCKETVDDINGVIGESYEKALLFARGDCVKDKKDLDNTEQPWVKALAIDSRMIDDPYVKIKLNKMIEKKINDAKKGTIQMEGNYAIICGDLYGLCQAMFDIEPTGLLEHGEFYAHYWKEKSVDEILLFRSPMTSHNNIVKGKVSYNSEASYWFRYLTTMIVFNNKDLSMESLNGADFDSDAVISTNNPTLLKRYVEMLPIVCEQSSCPKTTISEAKLRKSNTDGFGNDVGSITNKVTAMFDVLAGFKKGSKEYEEVMTRILCGQAYQQESIDKIKGIKAKTMPKEWFDYKANRVNIDYATGEIMDTDKVVKEKEFRLRVMANKKPYFFIYNYPKLHQEYKTFMKNVKDECLFNFRMEYEELIKKAEYEEEELRFLEKVKMYSPVFHNPSVMNKICWYIEDCFKDVKLKVRDDSKFDYSIMKSNRRTDKEMVEQITVLYKQFKQMKVDFNKQRTSHSDKKVVFETLQDFEEEIRRMAREICPDEDMLCNIVLDLCYGNKKDKTFAWIISQDKILENLLEKNGGCYHYPMEHENGNIMWKGKKYLVQDIL